MTAPHDGAPESFAPIVGKAVALHPITPADYEALFRLETSDALSRRWRLKGGTPSYEVWLEGLWRGVLAQFLVVTVTGARAVGLVTVYNANFKDRWAYFAAVKFDPEDRSEDLMHGLALFVSYCFSTWDFRKLYAEVSGYNLESFGSAVGTLMVQEGRLVDHEFMDGRWWDQHQLALYRDTWKRWEPIIMGRVVKGEKFRQSGDDIRPTRDWVTTGVTA